MILNLPGSTMVIDDVEYTIGAPVVATDESEYKNLYGRIFEIRTGEDQETGNDCPDIYCSFEMPEREDIITELEAAFSDLYRQPKTMDDIGIDYVILSPEMIRPATVEDYLELYPSESGMETDYGSMTM